MASSNSNSPTGSSALNHHLPPSSPEQLCYVHCNICDTLLVVSVPCSSLFNTVTVRCGHCSNLLPANMRGLLLPNAAHNQLHFPHSSFFFPSSTTTRHNSLDEIRNSTQNLLSNQAITDFSRSFGIGSGFDEHPKPPVINRPPEKRQRVPSAYNRFIKDEIQRIKAGNPDISHREAFSSAAKNWAHFPHIRFGLMSSDQAIFKKTTTTSTVLQQGNADDTLVKDCFPAPATIGVYPY